MESQSFGQYLLERKVISPNQLLRAFDFQEQASPRFCEAAIALGLLTETEKDQLLTLQQQKTLRVGEVAVQMGLLSGVQVDMVLRYQKSSHLLLGEALVATNCMPRADLTVHLNDFKKAQHAWITQGLPGRLDPTGIAAPAVLSLMRFLTEVARFPSTLGDWTVQRRPELPRPTASAVAELRGDVRGAIGLVGPLSVCAELVSAMMGEPVDKRDRAVVEDGLAEFLNLVGGDLSERVAEQGKLVEVVLPAPGHLPEAGVRDHLICASLSVPGGELVLAILSRLG